MGEDENRGNADAEDGFHSFLYQGSNRIAFKEGKVADRVTNYLRGTPLWALYHENSKSYTSPGFFESTMRRRFLTSPAAETLGAIGKLQVSAERRFSLPTPGKIDLSLSEVLKQRRSSRKFGGIWSLNELSTLLRYSYGLRKVAKNGKVYRMYPSPGALYPNDLYVVVHKVNGVGTGIYIYDIYNHSLVSLGHDVESVQWSFAEPDLASSASAIAILVANPFRTLLKYGEIGYKFAIIESGIILENLTLCATGLGKQSLPYASYKDRRLSSALGIDGLTKFVSITVLFG